MRRTATLLTCTLAATAASGETHVVGAYDMTFEPEVIEVNIGDTIRWEYVSGTPHTVTSGVRCTWDTMFYGTVSVVDPIFEWVVPDDASGEIPYFCAPHCINGMVGTIHVAQPCEGDLTGDGDVDGNDLLVVLDHWGADDPAGDANGNGVVDGHDLLLVLGNWGTCG